MVNLSETDRITMWDCSCCGRTLTSYDETENEVDAQIHFDIERSIKELYAEDDGDNLIIEERLENRNVKMNRILCESCFNKVLNESPTLKKTFLLDGKVLY